jgi:hypothetical protein
MVSIFTPVPTLLQCVSTPPVSPWFPSVAYLHLSPEWVVHPLLFLERVLHPLLFLERVLHPLLCLSKLKQMIGTLGARILHYHLLTSLKWMLLWHQDLAKSTSG